MARGGASCEWDAPITDPIRLDRPRAGRLSSASSTTSALSLILIGSRFALCAEGDGLLGASVSVAVDGGVGHCHGRTSVGEWRSSSLEVGEKTGGLDGGREVQFALAGNGSCCRCGEAGKAGGCGRTTSRSWSVASRSSRARSASIIAKNCEVEGTAPWYPIAPMGEPRVWRGATCKAEAGCGCVEVMMVKPHPCAPRAALDKVDPRCCSSSTGQHRGDNSTVLRRQA
jgi:hypothetical protein